MNCPQAREALAALVSGDLEGPQGDEVEAHLRSCPGCRAEFDELANAWQELGELPAHQAPEELQDQLDTLSADFRSNFSRPLAGSPRRNMLLHAVAALLLLAAGIVIGHRLQLSPQGGEETEAPSRPMPRYLLLLRETKVLELTDSRQEQLVLEYASWYRSLLTRGLGLQGERLHKDRQLLVGTNGGVSLLGAQAFPEDEVAVSGYFLIQAESLAEALGIASTCPHLRVGNIEVRALYPE